MIDLLRVRASPASLRCVFDHINPCLLVVRRFAGGPIVTRFYVYCEDSSKNVRSTWPSLVTLNFHELRRNRGRILLLLFIIFSLFVLDSLCGL